MNLNDWQKHNDKFQHKKDFHSSFDKALNKQANTVRMWMAFAALVVVFVLGGIAFVVYKLMAHFGVL